MYIFWNSRLVSTLCAIFKSFFYECECAFYRSSSTFSISSMVGWRSIPKSMNVHWIPSRSYSSCSRTNMWWLKNCCKRSLVKFIQSWLKPFHCPGSPVFRYRIWVWKTRTTWINKETINLTVYKKKESKVIMSTNITRLVILGSRAAGCNCALTTIIKPDNT